MHKLPFFICLSSLLDFIHALNFFTNFLHRWSKRATKNFKPKTPSRWPPPILPTQWKWTISGHMTINGAMQSFCHITMLDMLEPNPASNKIWWVQHQVRPTVPAPNETRQQCSLFRNLFPGAWHDSKPNFRTSKKICVEFWPMSSSWTRNLRL